MTLMQLRNDKRLLKGPPFGLVRRFLSGIHRKLTRKDDQDLRPPKNPFGSRPPFGGIPALAF